jgi:hypothetical protein
MECLFVDRTATSSNARKAGWKHTSKIRRQLNLTQGKTLSKTDNGGEEGSASGGDTEWISTAELDAIVEKVRSRHRETTAKMERVLDLACRIAR